MLKTLIIADDSTGANASAILLTKMRLCAVSLIDYNKVNLNQNADVLAISTDSRAVEETEAYNRVSSVLSKVNENDFKVLNKRIDSTLRGNIGAELNAFKDRFPNLKIAIVPVFPSSKRVTVNGIMYVNGIKLEETDVAKDPKMPIHISNVTDIIMKQFKGSVANIYLYDVRDPSKLPELITKTYETNDAIIFDGETDADIRKICQALVKANIPVIATDPGPFTYFYTKEVLRKQNDKAKGRFVYLIGSVTDNTYKQLVAASKHEDFELHYINPNKLLEGDYEELTKKLVEKVKKSPKKVNILTTTDLNNPVILDLKAIGDKLNLSTDDVSKKINDALAIILTRVLDENKDVYAIFTSGGDTTLGFLNEVNAEGFKLFKQVMPLCVFGELVKGSYEGLKIITKGGMIGDENAFIEIKDFLEEELENE
ncbi:TPA: four-carbon acid sugar kinase family protein [bacterium]|nr:four-carbon acid sugar kinase family protein [bacterium]